MRIRFNTETFPTLDEILGKIKNSTHFKSYFEFLNMYYPTLLNMSKVFGFSLVRFEFQELRCIVQRTEFTIILELRHFDE